MKKNSILLLVFLLGGCEKLPSSAQEYECCNEKEITYANGKVDLAATLLTPKGEGPFPGAVLLQGAGDSGRSNMWSGLVARSFVELGFAVLWTDKRGSDKSGGDWRTSDFIDLAEDALAGVAVLKDEPNIRPDMVGLLGLSQGGHVAPEAHALGDIDFVVSLSASSLPIKQTFFHELEQTYKNFGLPPEEIEFLQRMTTASFRYIETGEGWEDYLKIRAEIYAKYGDIAVETWPGNEDNWYWTFWRGIAGNDPMPLWKGIIVEKEIPVFVAYGELDEFNNVPVNASVARFGRSIDSENFTLRVYKNTGHGLWTADDPNFDSETDELKLVQPLLDNLEAWIIKNIRQE